MAMVYENVRNTANLFDFKRIEPKHHRDALEIELRDGTILYVKHSLNATIADDEIWRLDFESTPLNLNETARKDGWVGYEVIECQVGRPLILDAYSAGFVRKFVEEYRFTTAAVVVSITSSRLPTEPSQVNLDGQASNVTNPAS